MSLVVSFRYKDRMFCDDENRKVAKAALVRLIKEQLKEDNPLPEASSGSSLISGPQSDSPSATVSGESFHQQMKRIRLDKDKEVSTCFI